MELEIIDGNQYVWIPVGNGIKKSDGTTQDITLGRYIFADGTNHKAEDGTTPLAKGTPILKQDARDYESETEIDGMEQNPTSKLRFEYYQELKTSDPGVVGDGHDGRNATALNLKGFIDSVNSNGGYYIARYEASYGTDGKANSKVSDSFTDSDTAPTTRTEGMLWNYINQVDAAAATREIYSTVTSDLINSYAWDTAVVYIQKFSEDEDYSRQDAVSINSSLTNTGANGDEVCKINDMASNTYEWTTEYSYYSTTIDSFPCTHIGGSYINSNSCTSIRYFSDAAYSYNSTSFRSALYL